MLLGLLSDPDKLSDELWAKDLLSDAVRDRIKTTLGICRYDKASMILTEVSRYIELPASSDAFIQFCDVLVNHEQPGLKEIAEKMISSYNYYYSHTAIIVKCIFILSLFIIQIILLAL